MSSLPARMHWTRSPAWKSCVLVILPDAVTLTSGLDSGPWRVVVSALELVSSFSAAGLAACGFSLVFILSFSFSRLRADNGAGPCQPFVHVGPPKPNPLGRDFDE